MTRLADSPRPQGVEKLAGDEGLYRVRARVKRLPPIRKDAPPPRR
jgi:hypothetical protein